MYNDYQREALSNIAPVIDPIRFESQMPTALTYLRGYKKRQTWYWLEDENADMTLTVMDVTLTDEQVKRLNEMLADNPDELPLWELIENSGDAELLYAMTGAKDPDQGYIMLPETFSEPHHRYKFSVMVFPTQEDAPKKFECDIVLSDDEYCRLLVAIMMDREYFTFNHLASIAPKLYASITEQIMCSLQTPTYAHEFAVWCDEAMEDVKAIELLKQPENPYDEVTGPNFFGAIYHTEVKEFLNGSLSLDAFVEARSESPRDENMDGTRRCYFATQLSDYKSGKLSYDEAYDALLQFVEVM